MAECEYVINFSNNETVSSFLEPFDFAAESLRTWMKDLLNCWQIGTIISCMIAATRTMPVFINRIFTFIQLQEKELFIQTAEALAGAIDAKDNYTHGHSVRVADYSRKMAKLAGKSEIECEETEYEYTVIKRLAAKVNKVFMVRYNTDRNCTGLSVLMHISGL